MLTYVYPGEAITKFRIINTSVTPEVSHALVSPRLLPATITQLAASAE